MSNAMANTRNVVAGLVQVVCSCCAAAQQLLPHPDLDGTRLVCPETLNTYLDRGDGLFEPDGECLTTAPQVQQTRALAEAPLEPEVLSDRPARTGPKSRILLEKATFAEQV